MDPCEIEPMLARHRRRRFRPWLCRCGLRYPCGPRLVALDEKQRQVTQAAIDWYPRYFAHEAHAERVELAKLRDPGQWSR